MISISKLMGAAVVALLGFALPAQAGPPIRIVAAENFYGDIASQIGGPAVAVTSILSNPDQDPHLFETSPSVARAVSGAQIVVLNGAAYDAWMEKLLAAAKSTSRANIVVADLVGAKAGDNPHLWYVPAVGLRVAQALAEALIKADPASKPEIQARLAKFEASLAPINAKIAELRGRLSGQSATATEPVFGLMLEALGFQVRNEAFQRAVMNNTEPGASDVAAFERDLKSREVKLLVFNTQAADPVALRMKKLALASKVPVVGVSETLPAGKTYQTWLLGALKSVELALPPPAGAAKP